MPDITIIKESSPSITSCVEVAKLIIANQSSQGPSGPQGDQGVPGSTYSGDDLPDFTLIFDNKLV